MSRSKRLSESLDKEELAVSHVPDVQRALLLRGPRQAYELVPDYPVPKLQGEDEVLIRTKAIGLNPIDWRGPDFNFGIPELPYIAGRELSGLVAAVSGEKSAWKVGDRVIAISTDYRDLRKGAYQEYVVAVEYNLVRLPHGLSYEQGSTIGVAFITAAMTLGICLGVDFSRIAHGQDILRITRDLKQSLIPEDVREESLHGIQDHERPTVGDWLVVWGGSASSAHIIIQLAKLAGMRVIVVVDKAKHGLRLSTDNAVKPDVIIDSHDPQRAVQIIRAYTKGQARYGVDTRGKDTATLLMEAFADEAHIEQSPIDPGVQPYEPVEGSRNKSLAHIVGLAGIPKIPLPGIKIHSMPIKLFHEVPEIGRPLATWLSRLLEDRIITHPKVLDVENDLGSINKGLDRMRVGEISGGKLIVKLKDVKD
ncbi:chaperonin 10-like protein [Stachybotrys elegans]|uniref:Chaperonin 10-like protein n=1 Tax=Stachybotrys elegans TaxID=80388 RepID=A0A8K0WTC2_9HYPO|nr:chaperonin 10-like protein [Stachybotrys elegans]